MPQQKKLLEAAEKISLLQGQVERAFVDDIPNQFRDGGFIAKGFSAELDELIDIASNSQAKVRELEAKEKELTGIASLKIRYNNVFGYYIEITNTHKSKVPSDRYQRKQTLTNAERYVTDELNELEKKVITAKTRRAEVELEVLGILKNQLIAEMRSLLLLADQCNQLDVVTALAWLAIENSYCRPVMKEGGAFSIRGSRHAVVEQVLSKDFVANDIQIEPEQTILITGPNMAGKSTLMRQIAITSIMAQMGCFVPASSAELPVVDKIFTRIGASDFLTEGLSTFMVEMTETAEMLKQSTHQSLVILDEVGRGTSTYDGMSLAQSILEYFLRQLKSYTLFATHYHELTQLEQRYPGQLANRHMAISEKGGEILFRYQLQEGPAEKSYGIQVAKLAGLPAPVIQYANQLLQKFENAGSANNAQLDLWQSHKQTSFQSSEVSSLDQETLAFVEAVRKLEIQNLTPLDALNRLAQWQQELS